MPSTRSLGEPILPFVPKLNENLHRMNDAHSPTNNGSGINRQLPSPVEAHNKMIVENPGDGVVRGQPPVPRSQE